MKNLNQIDDQKVFTFINSNSCNFYEDLKNFLYENKLPIKSRWAFYFFGKKQSITENVISSMEIETFDSYGGYINGEIYYWDCYLNSSYHFKEREFIQLKLIENGEEANEQNIQEEYIKQGYNFVEKSLKNDKECENYRWLEEYSNNQVYIEPSNEFEVCSACQESPCLCSDRERTSTIHDF